MSKRVQHPARNAAVALAAAGLGASVVFGGGAAFAAEGQAPAANPAAAVAAQAEVAAKVAEQAKAAQAAAAKKAAAKKSVSWVKPVTGYTLSASFNQGGAMWAHKHSGQDFAVPVGTPVKAAFNGTVVKAGPNGGGDGPAYGNAIVVKHANGKYSQYAHLSQINVRIGQQVKTGQLIAKSGNTGNSSGPHLHFEVRTTANYGSALNPVSYLRTVGVTI
ncbi:M23 family metallopeptidase [Streptomyces sp. LP05-1]|uniref:M23 family metallopeptidase n=1 Tax=Streptomyces pyxinae TaxID=2970734 RepID=A0ABT2CQG9_9ACTN|nr:M23 family metallopeptidase [Streptomyces sp. LP05-1]MCS0639686.1 M23 family metallopeptidase [Streptomyces sp. LP05-1]